MADILCGYTADRDETLIAYLYDDIEGAQRAAFEAHIATCERCRYELNELRGVRDQLQAWTMPETARSMAPVLDVVDVVDAPATPDVGALSPTRGPWRTLQEIPAWAQVAAAVLVLGVSARLANLDIRYDRSGMTIRTGWSRTLPGAPVLVDQANEGAERRTPADAAVAGTPWRADLDALEGRLKSELHASPASVVAATSRDAPPATVDSELLHQMRTLVRESERKQQNELALRIAEVVREFDSKRGTDLVNINQTLRTMQSSTGIEVLKQREALSRLDYLVRASGQR